MCAVKNNAEYIPDMLIAILRKDALRAHQVLDVVTFSRSVSFSLRL